MYQEQYREDTYGYWSVEEERFSVAIDNMEVVPCCSVKHPRTTSDPRTRMILKTDPARQSQCKTSNDRVKISYSSH